MREGEGKRGYVMKGDRYMKCVSPRKKQGERSVVGDEWYERQN